jgi:lipoprotein-releasing system ATP-binding protein
MPDSLVQLTDVSKHYGGTPVLREVSLQVAAGERLAIMGPSGTGKSTLLNIMGTLDTPSSGSVSVAEQAVAALDDNALARLRCEHLGFVFQAHHLLPQCTVLENVLVPAMAGGAPSEETIDYAQELLGRVGLGDRASAAPAELSGGERQRVATVRALINRPALLLADEPTGALDEETAGSLATLLLELAGQAESALVVVTHDREVASRIGRTVLLRGGQLEEG